jgi:hypothetical protein
MRTSGVKLLDPTLDNLQIDWLLVPAKFCQTHEDEERFISTHFRRPHDAWTPNQAFVMPVNVRRSQRRVLFCQRSGLHSLVANS